MPNFGHATDLPTILAAMTTKLTTAPFTLPSNPGNPMDPSQVTPTLASEKDVAKFQLKDVHVIIRPRGFPIDGSVHDGGGNLALQVNGVIELTLFTRLWTGGELEDLARLTDASFGVLANWKAIMAAFSQWVPIDSVSGDCILCQPARFSRFDVLPREAGPSWTMLTADLNLKFIHSLS